VFFYLPNINSPVLEKPFSDHFFSMRVKVGQVVFASNLSGTIAKIEILKIDKKNKQIEYKIISRKEVLKKTEKILYQAILDKNYLEKLFEILPILEVTKICLFASQFSLDTKIKIERLEKILIRSCEQCQNPFLPKVEILEKNDIFNILDSQTHIILEKNLDYTLSDLNQDTNFENFLKIIPLVGPEGGWSKEELDFFRQKNLRFVNLGNIVYPAWMASSAYFLGLKYLK
jgi:16S rRNA (uracil1498-N3)-methyltransferase